MKTSDLVDQTGQVPELGAVGQVAPQLFDMTPGAISGPINAGRTGVVAKLVDKQQPSDAEIAKNLDQIRDQLLEQKTAGSFRDLCEQHHQRLQEEQSRAHQRKGAEPAYGRVVK